MSQQITGYAKIVNTSAVGTVSPAYQLISLSEGAVFLETKDLNFGSAFQKYLDAIVLHIDRSVPFVRAELKYWWRDRLEDEKNWSLPYSLTTTDHKIDVRATARYFGLSIADYAPTTQWKLSHIGFYGQVLQGRL